ncbi:oxidoreductase [Micromonospora sp. NPDC005710]|uniref:oxidoreductase n=1 Tax=Micromonospora sp. NPDC005710 TaxID=3157051 RepID=UPI0033E20FD5
MSVGGDAGWGFADIPRQDDRTVLVTGANTGIGYAVAQALATRGAHVVLGCRDDSKASAAAVRIRAIARRPVETLQVDLASLAAVKRAAEEFTSRFDRLDLLINNAGVMKLDGGRQESADGFELHLGINHLGPFALTGLLLDALLATPGSRIVHTSSTAHRWAAVRLDDLDWRRRRYQPTQAYAVSKAFNLMTVYELQRRLTAAGHRTIAVAAHPGFVRTAMTMGRGSTAALRAVAHPRLRRATSWLLQDGTDAALPTLRAAVDPHASGGDFYGPGGIAQLTGAPVRVEAGGRARDTTLQQQLWEHSSTRTGVDFTHLNENRR